MVDVRWNNIVDKISFDLWAVFDFLKTRFSTSEYHFILFLLSIYKDGIISNSLLNAQNNKRILIDEVRNSSEYQDIADLYIPMLERLDERELDYIIHQFLRIDKYSLQENFRDIFDFTLYKISDVLGKKEAGILQPIELTQLILELSDLKGNEKIFNPFAGLASFGVFLRGQRYFGQEYSADTWAIGKLRLMAYGVNYESEYRREDSITHWPAHEQYDLVVSNPPMDLKLGQMYRFDYPQFRTLEPFLIDRGISSINSTGKLISVLPLGFLFRGRQEQFMRERIVEDDLLDTVISMPSGLLSYTSIPFCIVVLNKAKDHSGLVRFIDASKYISSENKRDKRLDYHALVELIKSNVENKALRYVSNNLIREYRYNLNVPRYFVKEYYGKPLDEICEYFRGNRVTEENGKFVRIRDLKDDKVDNELNVNQLETVSIPRSAKKIDESCLLVASRWKTLKPTYFKYEGEPIFVPAYIFSLRIDEEHTNVYYLINELLADYVTEQLDALRLGGAIPTIRKDDLLSVKINILPLEEQNAKVKGLQELSDKLKLLLDENIKVEQTKSTEAFNEFASLKHSTGTPRQNILSNAKSLVRFFEQNQSNAYKEINNSYLERYDVELIEVFKQIRNDINHISLILERGENGLILEDYTKDLISLKDINDFVKDLPENGYDFKIKRNYIPKNQLSENGIESNIVLLRVLFDNILKNAHKYGFKNKEASNEVVIDLQIIDDLLEITIKNNGFPFPKNYTQEKFIEKFNTTDKEKGTGIGGYDINRIAKYLGDSEWVMDLNPTELYPVAFKFLFIIKTLK